MSVARRTLTWPGARGGIGGNRPIKAAIHKRTRLKGERTGPGYAPVKGYLEWWCRLGDSNT